MPVNSTSIFILIFLALVAGGIMWMKRRNSAQWFSSYWATFENCLRDIETILDEYKLITSYQSGYLNSYKLRCWKVKADDILLRLKSIPSLRRYISKENVAYIDSFETTYNSCDKNRENYNNAFVKFELEDKAGYLQTILSRPLDTEQRNAIVTDEDCNLIVAGAGCGKTTTIEGKVKYLIDRYKVDPSEIVLISFTRKSSEEMDERIRHRLKLNVKVQTFHSMGLDIIGLATNRRPDVIEESSVTAIISNSFSEQRKKEKYLSLLNDFFISYLKVPQDETKVANEGEVAQFLKDNNIASLKEIRIEYRGNVTIARQFCRSREEVLIANFLYLNQIDYEYEPEYIHDTSSAQYRQYKPDFYLPKYGIYIEHYGVDRNQNVPQWFGNSASGEFNQRLYDDANVKYKEKIKWADSLHAKYKTQLIKTFSWENRDGVLLTNLETKLTKAGVVLNPLDAKQVWATIIQAAENDVTDFELLIKTFFTLLKSNHKTVSDIRKGLKNLSNDFLKRRSEIFLELFEPIYNDYEKSLSDRKLIDFNDMINLATKHVRDGKYTSPIKYILVDEFQDISFGRYNLLKSLLDYNAGSKIFCVGDDWQSVFRFTGSDISLFTDFEKYFGVTKRSTITTTYRFNKDLIRISSNFIQKNPNQVKKVLSSKSSYAHQGLQILKSTSQRAEKDTAPIKIALDQIINDPLNAKCDFSTVKVMMLGRYNHDKKILENSRVDFSISENKNTGKITIKYNAQPLLNIQYLTIHGAKGLEADYVILLNCNSGKYGLPSERADDPILNLLLSNADQFENGEERRLFYVALTRTKRKVFLITSERSSSKFIKEIYPDVAAYIPPKPAWDDLPF